MTQQIVVEVSAEAKAMADEAAKFYGFADAAAHIKEWMKNTLIAYQHQRHDAAQAKEKAKLARGVETMFEE